MCCSEETGLKTDAVLATQRTIYSLRHTGDLHADHLSHGQVNIFNLAKNTRYQSDLDLRGSLRRLAVKMLRGFFGIDLRGVHGPVAMLGGRVKRVDVQRFLSCIDDVVPCASRNRTASPLLMRERLPVDQDFALPFLDTEKLIAIIVNFFPDFFSRLERHHDELKVLSV